MYGEFVRLVGPINSGAAVGKNGVATANASTTTRIIGRVAAVYVKYNDSPPGATTDVVVKALGTSPEAPTYNILTRTDTATSGWFYPRVQVTDTAGAGIANTYDLLPIYDLVNVKIDQANAADNVDVWLLLVS